MTQQVKSTWKMSKNGSNKIQNNMKYSTLLILFLVLFNSHNTYSQELDVEGMWLVCNSEEDCDDSQSGVYMKFEKNTMQTYVQVSGIEPQKVGEQLTFEWQDGKMVVSKKGDLMKDRYYIEIKKDRMTMKHSISGSIVYLERR